MANWRTGLHWFDSPPNTWTQLKLALYERENSTFITIKNLEQLDRFMTIIFFRSKKSGIFQLLYLGIVFSRKIKHSPLSRTADEMYKQRIPLTSTVKITKCEKKNHKRFLLMSSVLYDSACGRCIWHIWTKLRPMWTVRRYDSFGLL